MNRYQQAVKEALENPNAVILDTETTGLSNDARIIDLGILAMDGKEILSETYNPQVPLPEIITQITGYTDSDVKDCPTFTSKAKEIYDLLKDKLIIGWNIQFDMKRLNYEFSLAGLPPLSNCFDVMRPYAMAFGYIKGSYYTRKLCEAKVDMKVEGIQTHHALGDCIDTLAVAKAFVECDIRD